jgi:hypothetical protein
MRTSAIKSTPDRNMSASLSVQHGESWMNKFLLPLASDGGERAGQLESMGKSSHGLMVTPDNRASEGELLTGDAPRLAAIEALDGQLVRDIAAARLVLSEAEFTQLLTRLAATVAAAEKDANGMDCL